MLTMCVTLDRVVHTHCIVERERERETSITRFRGYLSYCLDFVARRSVENPASIVSPSRRPDPGPVTITL